MKGAILQKLRRGQWGKLGEIGKYFGKGFENKEETTGESNAATPGQGSRRESGKSLKTWVRASQGALNLLKAGGGALRRPTTGKKVKKKETQVIRKKRGGKGQKVRLR